jgi:ELWxxDGT repeat protein
VVQVADIQPGGGSSDPQELTVFRGELYFSANSAARGSELWKVLADGSAVLAGDIAPGGGDAGPYGLTPHGISAAASDLMF